jgi:hypothetical protein
MEQRYKLTDWNRQTAAFGLAKIAEAFSCNPSDYDSFVRNIKSGMRYFDEFIGDMNPTPKLSEQEANMASSLHTYLRKGTDAEYSIILYRMISESKGINIWYAFIKGITDKKFSYSNGIKLAEAAKDVGNDTTDDYIMLAALNMWEPDWKYVEEWFGA